MNPSHTLSFLSTLQCASSRCEQIANNAQATPYYLLSQFMTRLLWLFLPQICYSHPLLSLSSFSFFFFLFSIFLSLVPSIAYFFSQAVLSWALLEIMINNVSIDYFHTYPSIHAYFLFYIFPQSFNIHICMYIYIYIYMCVCVCACVCVCVCVLNCDILIIHKSVTFESANTCRNQAILFCELLELSKVFDKLRFFKRETIIFNFGSIIWIYFHLLFWQNYRNYFIVRKFKYRYHFQNSNISNHAVYSGFSFLHYENPP